MTNLIIDNVIARLEEIKEYEETVSMTLELGQLIKTTLIALDVDSDDTMHLFNTGTIDLEQGLIELTAYAWSRLTYSSADESDNEISNLSSKIDEYITILNDIY